MPSPWDVPRTGSGGRAAPRCAARPIVTGDDGVRGASGRPRGARRPPRRAHAARRAPARPPARAPAPAQGGRRRARRPGRPDRHRRGARRAPPPLGARDHLPAAAAGQRAPRGPARGASATTRSSSWRARPARARRPSCPSSASSSGAACAGRSATPSRGGSPPARSPSGSPRSSASALGEAVGYAVRFSDRSREDTLVRVMTDGLLLAEIQHDPLLRRYDTLIVDEAHERSLNIDFLLGYVARILPQRPDLKLVITSATIDPERFSRHFGDAPVVEVSGRTYPVEVRYRAARGRRRGPGRRDRATPSTSSLREGPGDVLVFLSGEREIRDTAEALTRPLRPGRRAAAALRAAVLGRAAAGLQAAHRGPRIVLATNVAETSLTVPGIRYVVDPGTARISRYSARLKVQRLPIEPISQASADQRKGRCGRTSDGICIRLYGEEDFEARPRFTDPEILRTSLAAVILQMAAARARRGRGLPVPRPARPPPGARRRSRCSRSSARSTRARRDPARRLTALGARARAAAGRPAARAHGPRGRPPRLRGRGDRHRRRAVDPGPARAARRAARGRRPGARALRGLGRRTSSPSSSCGATCASSSARCRAARSGACAGPSSCTSCACASGRISSASCARRPRARASTAQREPAEPDAVHQALLAGLLSHVGLRDPRGREYQGARGARFALWPGSALARRQPAWVMVAELVETSRLWGRTAARVQPSWIEPLAGHLLRRSYAEPRWDRRRAQVVATERATLYGLPVVDGRTVAYGRIDPVVARELFIRRALVEREWETRHAFLAENDRRLEEVEALEARARRRDIRVTDDVLFAFYDERLPPEIVSGAHFDRWWRDERRNDPERLTFPRELLVAGEVDGAGRPDDVETRRSHPRPELQLRPRDGPRRRHRPRPADRARHARARRLRVARPGLPARARDDADPHAAQGAAAHARPGAGGRGAGARAGRSRARGPARRARARADRACRAPPGTPGGCPRTCA